LILNLIDNELSTSKLNSGLAIGKQFEMVANALLNGYVLVTSGVEWRLFEIEFYYHSLIHQDPYVHCHPQQLSKGRWYFHKTSSYFKSGFFRGVDLTFGDEIANIHGGILIRGIVNPDAIQEYLYGPAKCVNYFNKNLNIGIEAVDDKIATDEECPQFFLREKKLREELVINGPRVGLKLRTGDDNEEFFRYSDYRYMIHLQLPHKGKKALIIPSLLKSGWTVDNIKRTFGVKI